MKVVQYVLMILIADDLIFTAAVSVPSETSFETASVFVSTEGTESSSLVSSISGNLEYPPVLAEPVSIVEAIERVPLYAAAVICSLTGGWLFSDLCVTRSSDAPSAMPSQSLRPSQQPTQEPSVGPSGLPSQYPSTSMLPTLLPSSKPSDQPSGSPFPSLRPSNSPTSVPSAAPTVTPSASALPTASPSTIPSLNPSGDPTSSLSPSSTPTSMPSVSMEPSTSTKPSSSPTNSIMPSTSPVSFSQNNLFPAESGLATNLTPQGPATTPVNVLCGHITTVLGHPSDSNICFAGAVNGGVWRTTNCLAASPLWIPLTDNEASLSVTDMVFDENDLTGNTVVVATGPESPTSRIGFSVGFLKTTNALAPDPEWIVLDNRSGSFNFRDKTVEFREVFSRGNLLLAGGLSLSSGGLCSGGIFRSTDSGTTWSNVLAGLSGLSIVPDPLNADRFFAIVTELFAGACGLMGKIFYVTTDAGATWEPTNAQPVTTIMNAFAARIEILVSPVATAPFATPRVWFVVRNQQSVLVGYSDDIGDSWTTMDSLPGPNNFDSSSLVASPDDRNVVYFGGQAQTGLFPNSFGAEGETGYLFRGDASSAAGSQWEHITNSNTASGSAPHSSSNDLSFRADDSLLEGNGSGIVVRTNPSMNTGDWFSLCGTGLQAFETIGVAYEPRRNTVLFGTRSSGTILGTLGDPNSYNTVTSTSDGNFVMIDHTSDPDFIYYYVPTARFSSFSRLKVSVADGTTTRNELTLPATTRQQSISGTGRLNPANQAQFAVEFGAVTGSTSSPDFGKAFIAFTADRGDSFQSVVVFVNDNGSSRASQMAWATDGSVLYISDSNLNLFSACSTNDDMGVTTMACTQVGTVAVSGDMGSRRIVRELAVDPNDASVIVAISVLLGFGPEDPVVLRSTNGGTTWVDATIAGSPFDEAEYGEAIAFIPAISDDGSPVSPASSLVIVGTNRGVFVEEAVAGWRLLASGLPNVRIIEITYDATDDILVVATLGRGVWFLEKARNALGSFQDARWRTS